MSTLTKPKPAANPHLADDIAALVALGERVRFKDFARLRSGYDAWSELGLSELRQRAGPAVVEAIRAALPSGVPEARGLRWCLRGLPVGMAIKKVQVDAEVGTNAEAAGKGH
jgi:ribonuclease HI